MTSAFLTIDDQSTLLAWAGERVGVERWVADSEAFGLIEEGTGRIVAVCVLNVWMDDAVWLHLATDGQKKWAWPFAIGRVLAHAFLDRGVKRVVARICAKNVPAQVLALKAGFEIEGRERVAFRGEDVIVFAMLREDCKWLDEEAEEC